MRIVFDSRTANSVVIIDLDKLELSIKEYVKEAKGAVKAFPSVKTRKSDIPPPLVLLKELADMGIDAFEATFKAVERRF